MSDIEKTDYDELVTELFGNEDVLRESLGVIGRAAREGHTASWRVPAMQEKAAALIRRGIPPADALWLCTTQEELRAEGVFPIGVMHRYLETVKSVAAVLRH